MLNSIIRVMMRAAVDTPQPIYVMIVRANLSSLDNCKKYVMLNERLKSSFVYLIQPHFMQKHFSFWKW